MNIYSYRSVPFHTSFHNVPDINIFIPIPYLGEAWKDKKHSRAYLEAKNPPEVCPHEWAGDQVSPDGCHQDASR